MNGKKHVFKEQLNNTTSTKPTRDANANANANTATSTNTTSIATSNHDQSHDHIHDHNTYNSHILQSKYLKKFNLYNWKPDLALSVDVNYMDLVLLITRNSFLKQGSMGCIIVTPINDDPAYCSFISKDKHVDGDDVDNDDNGDGDGDGDGDVVSSPQSKKKRTNNNIETTTKTHEHHNDKDDNNDYQTKNDNNIKNPEQKRIQLYNQLEQRIIAASTNESFYNINESDIHAEIVALGQCNQNIHTSMDKTKTKNTISTTKGCTAYITMPPCKRCFSALVKAGIGRIVTPRHYETYSDIITNVAKREDVDLVGLSSFDNMFIKKQQLRIQELIALSSSSMSSISSLDGNNTLIQVTPTGMMIDENIKIARKRRKEEKAAKKKIAKKLASEKI